jgi:hypothetical protein
VAVGSFDLVLKSETSLHTDGEPSRFVTHHAGVIRYERESDCKVFRAGRFAAYRIQAGLAANAGESLFDVCDSHSAELHEVHTLLYEPEGFGFKEALVRRFDAVEGDCLLLDYVVLHPRWRGLRLGLLAIRQAVDVLGGGCGLAVCDVAPLNPEAHASIGVPESWVPRHDTPRARREATVKLRRYARLMGFVRLGRTNYYALPVNHVTPTADELLRMMPQKGE